MFIKYEMSWFKVVHKHSDMFPENLRMCVWSSAKNLTYRSNTGLLNFILIILYENKDYEYRLQILVNYNFIFKMKENSV